jgi:hypothetical protein
MKRPLTLTIAVALMFVLILISAVWPMVGGQRLIVGTGPRGGSNSLSGTPPSGNLPQGTPPARPNSTQSGANSGQPGVGPNNNGSGNQFQPGDGNRGTRGGMMQFTRIFQYILYAVEFILGLIAIGGLWASRRWGIILSIITSAIVLISTIPGIFRSFSTISLIENLLKILLAICIIVLVVLPKFKLVNEPVQK